MLIFLNNQTFPACGTHTGQMQAGRAVVSILTIQFLDNTGLDIWEHIPGFPATLRNLVTGKVITVREHTQLSDIQQQQQTQLSLLEFR